MVSLTKFIYILLLSRRMRGNDYNTVFSVYINITNFETNFNIVKLLHLKKPSQCLLC